MCKVGVNNGVGQGVKIFFVKISTLFSLNPLAGVWDGPYGSLGYPLREFGTDPTGV